MAMNVKETQKGVTVLKLSTLEVKAQYALSVAEVAAQAQEPIHQHLLRAYATMLAEDLRAYAEKVFISPFTAELKLAVVPTPHQVSKGNKVLPTLTYWPSAKVGEMVMVDGKEYKVVFNATTPHQPREVQFGIYIIK